MQYTDLARKRGRTPGTHAWARAARAQEKTAGAQFHSFCREAVDQRDLTAQAELGSAGRHRHLREPGAPHAFFFFAFPWRGCG